MANETAKLTVSEADEERRAATKGFQSKAALDATKKKPVEEDDDPKSAVIDADSDTPALSGVTYEDQMRPVKVRSRTFLEFRYGPKRYALQPNKDCIVPLAVKRHLEEKGLL